MINTALTNDERLKPLFDKTSIIAWQVFILLIDDKKKKVYKITYSWVIISSRRETSSEAFLSDFKKVHKENDIIYSIAKLSLYNSPKTIVKIINDLFNGKSLCESLDISQINFSKINFDLQLQTDKRKSIFKVRPIIFNETNTLISRNFYDKASLNSPYQNVPSFSLTINNLDKQSLFKNDKHQYFENWKRALMSILNHLEDETSLPFSKSGCIRLGNIEFINTQCSNEYYINHVSFNNIKREIEVNNRKIASSNEVEVIIKPNKHTENKQLIINCFLTNGGQVILDECKELVHEKDNEVKVVFSSKEQIGKISVSIWKKDKDNYQIWYKHPTVLLRYISSSIGMVGMAGKVKSEWLDVIAKSNKKTENDIREAEKISKSSYTTMSIGDNDLDPWVKTDREFYDLVDKINPKKSESRFFPKGWDDEDKKHGAISFLKWFKDISDKAQHVVIQDPFFDTLGLDFLSRTTKSATKFSILTCTQVNSFDDDIASDSDISEPNRAKRLKYFIRNYPSLFDSLNIKINDLRSTGGGDKNILHDRYILIFENGELSKGFHLSNSIQGATKNHPLLITSIPIDVLIQVDSHLNEIINNADNKKDIELIQLFNSENSRKKIEEPDEVANEELLDKLNSFKAIDKPLKSTTLKGLLKENSDSKKDISNFWSTIGYFFARTSQPQKTITSLEEYLNKQELVSLREYIESSISKTHPIGFSDYKDFRVNSFQFLFHQDFKTSLKDSIHIGEAFRETSCFQNWGIHYGCKILIEHGFDEFTKLLLFIEKKYKLRSPNQDYSNTSLMKLSSIVFNCFTERLFWHDDIEFIRNSLKIKLSYIKPLSIAALLSYMPSVKSKTEYDEFKNVINGNCTKTEILDILTNFLSYIRLRKKDKLEFYEENIFNHIFEVLSNNFNQRGLDYIFQNCLNIFHPSIEKKFTEKVLFNLVESKKIDSNHIMDLWSNEFFKNIENIKSHKDYSGLIDITGWAFCIGDINSKNTFLKQIEKRIKSYKNEIQKPFKHGTIKWGESFEAILLIRTVLIIALLYDLDNEAKIKNRKLIINYIDDISILEDSYKPRIFDGKIKKYSQLMLKEYKTKIA